MNNLQERETLSRRKLLEGIGRIGGLGVAAAGGGLLLNDQVIQPVLDGRRWQALYNQAKQVAEHIYPSIPPTETYVMRGDFAMKDDVLQELQKPVIIGYDQDQKPIFLGYKEGDDLVQAYKTYGYKDRYTDEELDKPIDFITAYDRSGYSSFAKPDGTKWTLRERMYERPDFYNIDLRTEIDGLNGDKRTAYINTRLAALLQRSPWGVIDSAGLVLGIGGLLLNRLASKRATIPAAAVQSPRTLNAPTDKRRDEPLVELVEPSPAKQSDKRLEKLRLADFMRDDPGILPKLQTSANEIGFSVTSPFVLSGEERQTLQLAFQDESPENLEKRIRHVSTLGQLFNHYLLQNLQIPEGCTEVDAYSLGCGNEGAFESLSIQLVAKRLGIKARVICLEMNEDSLEKSKGDWNRLVSTGIVDRQSTEFMREDAGSFQITDQASTAPLLVIIRNQPPIMLTPMIRDQWMVESIVNPLIERGVVKPTLYELGKRIFPLMEKLHSNGSDARMLITSERADVLSREDRTGSRPWKDVEEMERYKIPERGFLCQAAQELKYGGADLSLCFLQDNELNPNPTYDTGWNDQYVTVVGF